MVSRNSFSKIWLLIFAIVTALCYGLFGCAKAPEEEESLGENQYYVYYLSSDGLSLETEVYQASNKSSSTIQMIDELLEAMKNPVNREHRCAIPEGVSRINRRIDSEILTVYFSDSYKKVPAEDEVMFRAAYVLTMTQIQGINNIYFYVNEAPFIDALGNPVGIMQASDFVEDIGSGTFRTWVDLSLYYGSADGTGLTAESITIGYGKKASVERAILEQLIAGPVVEGNLRTVPENLVVLSVSTKEGTCYVNFNSALIDTPLSVPAAVTVYSIVDSLCELSTVNRVKISINGNSNIVFRDLIDFSIPIDRNLDYVQTPVKEE